MAALNASRKEKKMKMFGIQEKRRGWKMRASVFATDAIIRVASVPVCAGAKLSC